MLLDLLKSALFALWAAFLLWLLTAGKNDLIHLLHPRLWWIIGTAAAVLILFMLSALCRKTKQHDSRNLLFELPGLLILLIPLLYFTLARDVRLDGSSLQNRITTDSSGMPLSMATPGASAGGSTPAAEGTEKSETSLADIVRHPDQYDGKKVEVLCQTFAHDKLPADSMMCYRYLITCCVADALPIFIFVDQPKDQSIEPNRWIKVQGKLSLSLFNDRQIPEIKPDSVTYVNEPDFPWVL